MEGFGKVDGEPVEIPAENLDLAFRLLTPESYFGDRVYEFVTPLVARAVIKHADGSETEVLVRDHGHNPAVVTIDGKNYFYARNDPDVHAGAIELIRMVNRAAYQVKPQQQTEP